jgi:hypothetical protein
MNVRVFYNRENQIVSIVELKEEKGVPPTSIFAIPDCNYCDVELTAEQARMPLIEIHAKHTVDFREKKARLTLLKITKPIE